MEQQNAQKRYCDMSPEEQTQHIIKIDEYIKNDIPSLIEAGRSIDSKHIDIFHRGLDLLGVFPQFAVFCVQLKKVRYDYDQYIKSMSHQFNLLVDQLSSENTVFTRSGSRVIVLQQSQSLRRGRPTAAESEQRKKEEQDAAYADAMSRLTGASISTSEPAPVSQRETDTSRRKKDEPNLFDAAITEEVSEKEHPINTLLHESNDDPSSHSSHEETVQLRYWLHILPEDLASRVRALRDLRSEMASERQTAVVLLEQGASVEQMKPHTNRVKEIDRDINALYDDIDTYMAQLYVMLTEVNADWQGLADKHMKKTGEPSDKLIGRLKPYAKKLEANTTGWFDATLAKCRKLEADRIARETRDPEKEALMHKMDAYIRRKDLKPSQKRLDKMREYRTQLAANGADTDSLSAYDVFIANVESALHQ